MRKSRLNKAVGRWLLAISCWLLAGGSMSAAEVVATVTSYNSAELSGHLTETMSVEFENSNHSKGNLTAGSEALLTILGMPECLVTRVELSMKSNAKSGAGSVAVKLGSKTVAKIDDSEFCDWPGRGEYSSVFVPIALEGVWQATENSELSVYIKASANSLALEKVSVTYNTKAPEPLTVNLSWLDADGNRQTSEIKEKEAGVGVILPECTVTTLPGDWSFVGWSQDKIAELFTSEPTMWKAGDKVYPQKDMTVYAVYRNTPDTKPIAQATTFQSGEYAIAMKGIESYYLMTGEVSEKEIVGSAFEVAEGSDGTYCLPKGYVSAYCRYQMDFEGDSVTVRYVQTGSYIGHNSTTLADKKSKWAWSEAKNHSIELSFGRVEKSAGAEGRVLWLSGAEKKYKVVPLKLGQDYEYLLLFDVSDAPTSSPKAKWTCCPLGAEGIETVESQKSKVESTKLLRNGQMIIRVGETEYDITGKRIQ